MNLTTIAILALILTSTATASETRSEPPCRRACVSHMEPQSVATAPVLVATPDDLLGPFILKAPKETHCHRINSPETLRTGHSDLDLTAGTIVCEGGAVTIEPEPQPDDSKR